MWFLCGTDLISLSANVGIVLCLRLCLCLFHRVNQRFDSREGTGRRMGYVLKNYCIIPLRTVGHTIEHSQTEGTAFSVY